MSVFKHIKEHAILGVESFGSKSAIIGNSGKYPTIAAAIAAFGDRIKQRGSAAGVTTTITNGEATVTFVGTAYKTSPNNTKPRVGDLIQFRSEDRYYKIKYIVSNTVIELEEPYDGTTATGVSMAHDWHYLDWVTLFISPGQHNLAGLTIPSGYVFSGYGAYSNTLSELSTSPGSPFNTVGECVFKDLTFAPTAAFGSLDAIARQNINPDGTENYWAGQTVIFDSCTFDARSLSGEHNDGFVNYPLMPNGTVIYRSCHMKNDNSAAFQNLYYSAGSGLVVNTVEATTFVKCFNCHFEFLPGYNYASLTNKEAVKIEVEATYLFKSCFFESVTDLPYVHLFPAIVGGVYFPSGATNITADFDNCRIRNSIPSATQPSHGILCDANVIVNVDGCSIEVDDDGIQMTNTSGTINVRGGRVKGGTNALNGSVATATINYDNNVTLIGGTTGAGVTNTPT